MGLVASLRPDRASSSSWQSTGSRGRFPCRVPQATHSRPGQVRCDSVMSARARLKRAAIVAAALILAGCGSSDSTVSKTPEADHAPQPFPRRLRRRPPSPRGRPPTAGPVDPCAVNLAAPEIAKAVSGLPRDPRSEQPWSPEPLAGNYNECAQLSAVVVKANTNADNPNTRAVMFHLGKFIPTGVPDTFGFNGIEDSATHRRHRGAEVLQRHDGPRQRRAVPLERQRRRADRQHGLAPRDSCTHRAAPRRGLAEPKHVGGLTYSGSVFVAGAASVIYSASDLAAAARCEYALLRAFDAKLGRGPRVVRRGRAARAHRDARRRARTPPPRRAARGVRRRRHDHRPTGYTDAGPARRPRADHAGRPRPRPRHLPGGDVRRAVPRVRRLPGPRARPRRRPLPAARHQAGPLGEGRGTAAARRVRRRPDRGGCPGGARASSWSSATAHRELPHSTNCSRSTCRAATHCSGCSTTTSPAGPPCRWEDADVRACFRCPECTDPGARARRPAARRRHARHPARPAASTPGITHVHELAAHDGAGARTVDAAPSRPSPRRPGSRSPTGVDGKPPYEVIDPQPLMVLPDADKGDLFFDFEGDPLWTRRRPRVGAGIPVGRADRRPTSSPRSGRTTAPVSARRWSTSSRWCASGCKRYPGMHVYHYAAYEKSTLLRLAGRYGVGENDVDDLLRNGVLVDLYPLVRKSIRVGTESYSIKYLEPLYMGNELRRRRGHHRHRLDHAVRPLLRAARRGRPRRGGQRAQGDRGLQPLRLPVDAPPARLADGPRHRVGGAAARSAARRRRRPDRRTRRRRSNARCSSSQATASRNAPPSRPPSRWSPRPAASTSARTSRSGGRTSTGSTTPSTNGPTTVTCSSPSEPRSSPTGTSRPKARKPQRHVRLTGELANGELAQRDVRAVRPARPRGPRRRSRPTGVRFGHGARVRRPRGRPPRSSSVERQPKDGDVFDQLPVRPDAGSADQHQAPAGVDRRHRRHGRRRAAEPARRRRHRHPAAPPTAHRQRRPAAPHAATSPTTSPPRCWTSTRPTSRCTARPAPARPSPRPRSSPGWSTTTAGASAWSRSPTRWSRTCSAT